MVIPLWIYYSHPLYQFPNLEHDLKYCLEHVKPKTLSIERHSRITCLQELSLAECRQLIVNGFNNEDDMINFICSK